MSLARQLEESLDEKTARSLAKAVGQSAWRRSVHTHRGYASDRAHEEAARSHESAAGYWRQAGEEAMAKEHEAAAEVHKKGKTPKIPEKNLPRAGAFAEIVRERNKTA